MVLTQSSSSFTSVACALIYLLLSPGPPHYPGRAATRAPRAGRRRSRRRPHRPPRPPARPAPRVPAGRLDAAASRTAARARRPVRVDREVTELGAETVGAPEDPATGHDAASHARAEREHHELACPDLLCLRQRGAVGVVVHVDRDAEAAAELLAQRDAGEWDVHARDDRAGRVLDLRG